MSLIYLGSVGENLWLESGSGSLSRHHRQGNRVYSSIGLASALSAQPVGGAGGYTTLYVVKEKRNVHQTSDQERLDLDGVGGGSVTSPTRPAKPAEAELARQDKSAPL